MQGCGAATRLLLIHLLRAVHQALLSPLPHAHTRLPVTASLPSFPPAPLSLPASLSQAKCKAAADKKLAPLLAAEQARLDAIAAAAAAAANATAAAADASAANAANAADADADAAVTAMDTGTPDGSRSVASNGDGGAPGGGRVTANESDRHAAGEAQGEAASAPSATGVDVAG